MERREVRRRGDINKSRYNNGLIAELMLMWRREEMRG
jgi:hypothetical protein